MSTRRHVIDRYAMKGGNSGINVANWGDVVVRDSSLKNGTVGILGSTDGLLSGESVHIVVQSSTISGVGYGVWADGGGVVITVADSLITRTVIFALDVMNAAQIISVGNNTVQDNATSGAFSSTTSLH